MRKLAATIKDIIHSNNLEVRLFESYGIEPQNTQRSLYKNEVSLTLIRCLGELLPDLDTDRLKAMKKVNAYYRFATKDTTTISSVVGRQKDDKFFSTHAAELIEQYGRTSQFKDNTHALSVIKAAVTVPRISGHYHLALINGAILARWLIREQPKGINQAGVLVTALGELGTTAGQLQNKAGHRFAVQLAKKYADENIGDRIASRLFLDMKGQLSETEYGADPEAAKSAIPDYNEAIVAVREIFEGSAAPLISEDMISFLLGVCYNKITALQSAKAPIDRLKLAFDEMDELARLGKGLQERVFGSSSEDHEPDFFRKLIYAQFLIKSELNEKAINVSEELTHSLSQLPSPSAYLQAKVNLVAGKAKLQLRNLSKDQSLDYQVDYHRQAALDAYISMKYYSGRDAVLRELGLPAADSKGSS